MAIILSASLCYSAGARAIEPRPIPLELPSKEEETSEEVIEGGVAATMLFATFGLGLGMVATAIDAESERKRDDACHSCPGGFNDMQRDMAIVANASLLSFLAAGILGTATTVYAATTELERFGPPKKKPSVKFRASGAGFVIAF